MSTHTSAKLSPFYSLDSTKAELTMLRRLCEIRDGLSEYERKKESGTLYDEMVEKRMLWLDYRVLTVEYGEFVEKNPDWSLKTETDAMINELRARLVKIRA